MTKEETQRACMRIGDNIDRYLKRAGMKGKETEIHHSGKVFRIREVAQ